jgi:tetratricopeptide (TPR) repeat protein
MTIQSWIARRICVVGIWAAVWLLAGAALAPAEEPDNLAAVAADKGAQDLLHAGLEHRKEGRYQEAVGDFTRALERDPRLVAALVHRGFCYRALGQPQTALHDLEQALKIDPASVAALYYRALVHSDRHDYVRALEDLDRAGRLDPRFPRVPLQRARVYAALARYEEAVAECTRALQLDPRSAPALGQRADAHLELDEQAKALADLDRAIALEPRTPGFVVQRGLLHLRAGHFEQAIADFDRALGLDDQQPWPRYNRAISRAILGQHQEAIDDLTEVIRLQPTNCNAFYARANSYRALGQGERAEADERAGERVGPMAHAQPPAAALFRSVPGEDVVALAAAPTEPRSKRISRATGLLVGANQDGSVQGVATCWVLDAKKRLAVTNFHALNQQLFVFFPKYDNKGRPFANLAFYLRQRDQIKAWVKARDPRRDLALLELARLPEEVAALPLAEEMPAIGAPVYSMGNSSVAKAGTLDKGRLWLYRANAKVLKVTPFNVIRPSNVKQQLEATFIETNSGVEGGDSGGPLCNVDGAIVGVIAGRQLSGERRSFAIALTELKGFLRDRGVRKPAAEQSLVGVWVFTLQPKEKKEGPVLPRFRFTFRPDGELLVEDDERARLGRYNLEKDRLHFDVPGALTGRITWKGNDQFTFAVGRDSALFERRR